MVNVQNFIDGSFCDPESGQFLENLNPATQEPLAGIPDSMESDVNRAVAAAKVAFQTWSKTPAQERANILYRLADLIEKDLVAFAQLESQDQGKPVSLARAVDIPRSIANFRFFAGAILHEESDSHANATGLNYTYRKPIGVAGLISPWNLPLYLLTWKIAPALATGNTAVCKPSEFTSLTAHRLASLMNEAGVPKGVCNFVFGTGPKAGSALTAHPDVRLVSFTGGTQTAQHIIQATAPHFKKLSLELGGKNACLIFEDVDIEKHLPTLVRGSFSNQGEICLCNSRIYVHESRFEEFVSKFVAAVKELKVGDPSQPETQVGALVSKPHFEKVKGYIELAKQHSGTIHCGGNQPDLPEHLSQGNFLSPTVVTGLDDSCPVIQEEIFGPVVTISPFTTEEEAVARANNVKYGLAASVFTNQLGRAHRVAQGLEAGIIWVNTWMNRDLRTPFGGMKASGVGREGGKYSLEFFTETQNICIATEELA